MIGEERVIAYWQAAQPLVEDSHIRLKNQQALYHAGRMGHMGLIIGVFAARSIEFGGISSELPERVANHRPTLESRGIELHTVTAPSAELVTRVHLRHAIRIGKRIVETELLNQASKLEQHSYDFAYDLWQNTGRLYVPADDETIPADLQQMLDEATLLDQRVASEQSATQP